MSAETQTTDDIGVIPISWQRDFLFVGKVGFGFVGCDMRLAPDIFTAYVGRDDNQIGHFSTRERARAAIVAYIKDGPNVPF